ncbi:MAG: hypothetical protein ABIH47_03715 [Candidatus Omnitrophota bacterium]
MTQEDKERIVVKVNHVIELFKSDPRGEIETNKEFERLPDGKIFDAKIVTYIYKKQDSDEYVLLRYTSGIPKSLIEIKNLPHRYFRDTDTSNDTADSLSVSRHIVETNKELWNITDNNIDGVFDTYTKSPDTVTEDIESGHTVYENTLDFIITYYQNPPEEPMVFEQKPQKKELVVELEKRLYDLESGYKNKLISEEDYNTQRRLAFESYTKESTKF